MLESLPIRRPLSSESESDAHLPSHHPCLLAGKNLVHVPENNLAASGEVTRRFANDSLYSLLSRARARRHAGSAGRNCGKFVVPVEANPRAWECKETR